MGRPAVLALDTGALVALARGDERTRAMLRAALNDYARIVVLAPVMAEAYRHGGQEAELDRVLKAFDRQYMTCEAGRRAAYLMRWSNSASPVDAMIVASAIRDARADSIFTSDPDDICNLDIDRRLAVYDLRDHRWIQRR